MKQLLTKLGAASVVLGAPAIASAQSITQGDLNFLTALLQPVRLQSGAIDLGQLAVLVLNFMIFIAAVLAIFYLIWAGIQYITAGTDEEKAKKARSGIYNAVIGIIVIVLSYFIIQFVANLARNTVQNFPGTGGSGTLGGVTFP